ncbi:hypothetical protein GCM10007904_13030 [Oharaeibacter diazotrophicus]|nr:hypothetical protein GCM10007904_13030 [Oharaeibacter diazotrophicus]
MSTHCDPAASIILRLGGVSEVAEIAQVDVSRVCRWRLPKGDSGGTGGVIPTRHVPVLLRAAKMRGIALSAEDFFMTDEEGLSSIGGAVDPGAIGRPARLAGASSPPAGAASAARRAGRGGGRDRLQQREASERVGEPTGCCGAPPGLVRVRHR